MAAGPDSSYPIFPVMASIFIARVIDRACLQGANRHRILKGTLLRPEVLEDGETRIPSACVYQAAENAATQSRNPYLCAEMSQEFDWFSGLSLPPNARQHPSLGDLAVAWLKHTNRDQNSSRFQMLVDAQTAVIRGIRLWPTSRPTGQPDAWDVGAWIKLLRDRLDRQWNSDLVSVRVSSPDAIPPAMLHPASVMQSDGMGTEIRFPSDWLMAETSAVQSSTTVHSAEGQRGFELDELFTGFDYADFPNFEGFAEFFGYEPKTLQRRFSNNGTSYSKLVDGARRAQSKSLLRDPGLRIQEVSEILGYRNPSAFDRAFHRWHGISPRKWRARLKNKTLPR